MRLHDTLGDREAEAGPLPAVGTRGLAFDEFIENTRQGLNRNTRPIVGDA